MMDSVGHYSRPELLSLLIDRGTKAASVDRNVPGWDRPTLNDLTLTAQCDEERPDVGR
jgi:hypothetical protein